MPLRALLLGLLLTLAAAPASGEEVHPLEAKHDQAIAAHLGRLDALADWTRKAGLYGTRHEIYQAILGFDPEHKKARKVLKYAKKDGTWVQRASYKPPKDFSAKKRPEYEAKRAEVEGELAKALGALFDTCRTEADLAWARLRTLSWQSRRPEDQAPRIQLKRIDIRRYQHYWSAGHRDALATLEAELKATYPVDKEIHALVREVEVDGQWILEETKASLAARTRLKAKLKDLLTKAKAPTTEELGERDLLLGLTGMQAFRSKHIRAAGTMPEKELRAFVTHLEVAGPFFEAAFDTAPRRRERLDAYLLAKRDHLESFLGRFPGLDPSLAKQQEQHGLHLFWANNQTLCAGPIVPEAQRELALGVLFMVFLADTWFGHDHLPGWLDEGIARHLSFLMTNTRFGIAVGGRYGSADPAVTRKIPDAHGNWLKAAEKRIGKLPSWDLRLLLGKRVDAFTANDSILAYIFSVYLIEGRPKDTVAFFQRIAKGEDPNLASQKALGMPLPTLEHRLRRYLTERAAR